MNPKGKLYTSNLAGLKRINFEADVLLITRASVEIAGTTIVKDLAPSVDLFQTFLNSWKNRPGPDWWPRYEERFLIELKSNIKINALRDVYRSLNQGKNVVLVCFCADHRHCHRRLVGEFFKANGVEAEELNPITIEQITIF